VRNQLGLALLGRGALAGAREQLERALALAPEESRVRAFVLKDLARQALAAGRLDEAEEHLASARRIADRKRYRDAKTSIRHVEAQILAVRTRSRGDRTFGRAMTAFGAAISGYRASLHPRALCEVALDKTRALLRLGLHAQARECLVDVALPVAERDLFAQVEPLATIEALLGDLDEGELLRVRHRRMLGGIAREEHMGRLRGERRRLTVWTCDIRGFSRFCDTHDEMLVVDMLNRFFKELGQPILGARGTIDKYVGDNILAYFPSAEPAAEVALAALARAAQLNTEWAHLDQPRLEIGVGVATGDVVEGNVGFSGKLEHTIIGTAVNRACRLVGVARAGEIVMDRPTRDALGARFLSRPWGRGRVALKGLGMVEAFRLTGVR
jgi:class 3 adenylate cyclase